MKPIDMVNAIQAQIDDIAQQMDQNRPEDAKHSLDKLDRLLDAYRGMLQKEKK